MIVYKPKIKAEGVKIGVVVSKFNEFISKQLLEGCIDTLIQHGVKEKDIFCVWVPGAFEIPAVVKKLAESKKLDAIICLGCVIRGDTPHFEYISSENAKGISWLSLNLKIPVIYGVLTTDNIEQAMERAGTKQGNKGRQAALDALEMIDIFRQI